MNAQETAEIRDLTDNELDRTAGGLLNNLVCGAIAGAQGAVGVHHAWINTNGCGLVALGFR
jgi:hypothetical protein